MTIEDQIHTKFLANQDEYGLEYAQGYRKAQRDMLAAPAAAVPAPVDERAAFEAWAGDQGFLLQYTVRGDEYQDLRTQGPWDAWQARAAQEKP